MTQVVTLVLAGVIWLGVLVSLLRKPSGPRWVRMATFAVLAVTVPLVAAAYVFYARS